MLKNFIITSGELIINVLVVIGLIIAVIGGFTAMQFSFFGGLLTLLSGAAGVVLLAFILYILIDIRDNLKQLNNK
jgi:hypothetical protein